MNNEPNAGQGPLVTDGDRSAGNDCWMDERFPQLTPELEVIQMLYQRFAAHRHSAVLAATADVVTKWQDALADACAQLAAKTAEVASLVKVLNKIITCQDSIAMEYTEQDWIEARKILAIFKK